MITEFEGFKVGDIVTCYFKGFYTIVGFEYKTGILPLQVIVQRIADGEGNPCGGATKSCIAASCRCAIASIDDDIADMVDRTLKLNKLKRGYTKS